MRDCRRGPPNARAVLDALVGLTSIGGGVALAAGLEGKRFPVEWLVGSG